MILGGFATPEGTRRYAERFRGKAAEGHFRTMQGPGDSPGLFLSSVGIGTYLGEPEEAADRAYGEAVAAAVESGANVIDTAINYRCQRSERVIGHALRALREKGFSRDEIWVATKGGFIPSDSAYPRDRNWFEETYVKTGILRQDEVVAGCHALSARYIRDQLERSLSNLSLDTIDCYYVHNPETQLESLDRNAFLTKMREVFGLLETSVREGKVRFYGAATWSGFLVSPEDRGYLSLEELAVLAREAGGPDHHFRVIQLPFNLAMPEAWLSPNQKVGGGWLPFLEAAARYGMTVMASASLMQGKLAHNLPASVGALVKNLETDAERALQFVRSAPGVTCALVGMKSKDHVAKNLRLRHCTPLSEEEFRHLFSPSA
jgi:aryl-alcohol dehydrogenase-like predicted oxidoreductase